MSDNNYIIYKTKERTAKIRKKAKERSANASSSIEDPRGFSLLEGLSLMSSVGKDYLGLDNAPEDTSDIDDKFSDFSPAFSDTDDDPFENSKYYEDLDEPFKRFDPVENEDAMIVQSTPNTMITSSSIARSAAQIASATTTFDSHDLGPNTPLGYKHYKGKCTSGPETYYRKAGLELAGYWWNTGSPGTATDTKITSKGFQEIWHGSRDDVVNGGFMNVLEPGDILLTYGITKGRNPHPSAHAAIWDGIRWVSDTDLGLDAWVYGKGRLGSRSGVLYRHYE